MSSNVLDFLNLVREIYSKPNYLIPLVTAQREFRQNNYQMGSAAQLEDLFFDSISFYVAENQIDASPKRRTGKESWDYKFFNQAFSHKETLKGGFTYKWQPGNQDSNNKWHAKLEKANFSEPVVLMYSNLKSKYKLSNDTLNVEVVNFTSENLKLKQFSDNSKLVLTKKVKDELEITKVWDESQWKSFTLPDIIKVIGVNNLLQHDLFLFKSDKNSNIELLNQKLTFQKNTIFPGLYIIELDQLKNINLIANNKAHSVSDEIAHSLMLESKKRENYLNIPLWPTVFANDTPPNLYQIQRLKYDQAMKPGGPRSV